MHKGLTASLVFLVLAAGPTAGAQNATGEPKFRELYKELVETNTALSNGSCTLAAERMAARLQAAGLPERLIMRLAYGW